MADRKPLISGNWKLQLIYGIPAGQAFAEQLR